MYSTNIEYGDFRIKEDKIRRHKIGANNTRINWGDYTRKHSTIASRATTIGSAERAPDNIIIKLFQVEVWWWSTLYLSLYSKKLFDYSLRGYSHRERWARTRQCLFANTGARKAKEYLMKRHYSHQEWVFIKSWLYNLNIFSQIRLRHVILELCYRNETRMPWFITKVRPQDPSCMDWYTHMDALYWYVSVSMTRRKSWWMHWVHWELLGFILCKS
jgi:hypothetical protein